MITVVWLHYETMVLYTVIHKVRQTLSIEPFLLSLKAKTHQLCQGCVICYINYHIMGSVMQLLNGLKFYSKWNPKSDRAWI